MPKAIRGALWAILATAGAGAAYGVLVPWQECSVTADRFTSAMFAMTVYVAFFGAPAALVGAILGAIVDYGGDDSRSEASKPTRTDDLAFDEPADVKPSD